MPRHRYPIAVLSADEGRGEGVDGGGIAACLVSSHRRQIEPVLLHAPPLLLLATTSHRSQLLASLAGPEPPPLLAADNLPRMGLAPPPLPSDIDIMNAMNTREVLLHGIRT